MNKLMIGVVGLAALIAAVGVGWSLKVEEANAEPSLRVYKSPTCGCCDDWVKHMERRGFDLETDNVSNMNTIKIEYGIDRRLQSCHTAVSEEGYFFEGHIPAKTVAAFLDNPPAGAKGLTAPGMPPGSPGMEMAPFKPYNVLLVKDDGSTSVYERVDSPDYE